MISQISKWELRPFSPGAQQTKQKSLMAEALQSQEGSTVDLPANIMSQGKSSR